MRARRKGSTSHLPQEPWEEGLQTHSLSLETASLCLVEGPLYPDGRICLLVFHGSGVSHHCLGGKICVNSKALRSGKSSEMPSELLITPRIIYPFHSIC